MLLYNCKREREFPIRKGEKKMMNLMRKMRIAKAVMTWTANHTGLPFTKKIFINGFKDVDKAFTENELEKVWNDMVENGTFKPYKGTDLYTV